jgi:hypothetical protein
VIIRKATKIKDKVFSSNQLAVSVVPIRELAHAKANTAINANNQMFFLNGTLSFDMAMVKLIENIFFEWWNLNIQNKKP